MHKIFSMILIVMVMLFNTFYAFAEESYVIQVGAFSTYENAEKQEVLLDALDIRSKILEIDNFYKVFVGPFSSESEALDVQETLSKAGFSSFIATHNFLVDEVTLESEEADVEVIPAEENEVIVEEVPDDEMIDETSEISVGEIIEVPYIDLTEKVDEDKNDFKLLKIFSILCLWLVFIVIVIAYRLKQAKGEVK